MKKPIKSTLNSDKSQDSSIKSDNADDKTHSMDMHGDHVHMSPHSPVNRHNLNHHSSMIEDFKKRFMVCLFLTVPVFFLTPTVQELLGTGSLLSSASDNYLLFMLSSVVFFYGGYPFFKGLINEFKSLNPGMMTLVSVAITTAYIYSSAVVFGLTGSVFFLELVTLVDIMLLGHWIEMRSIMGASRALEELATLMPNKAHKIMQDNSVMDVEINELNKGDKILVKPAEKLAADGIVVEGETWVDESLLTGESKPVHKSVGNEVVGGSLNGEGSIVIEVRKTGSESFISQVIELVNHAQESKSRTQDIANRCCTPTHTSSPYRRNINIFSMVISL